MRQMNGRDKRRRARSRKEQAEQREGRGAEVKTEKQNENGKRRCPWDDRLIDISVCIVRQHRFLARCARCTWDGGRAA